MNAMRWDVRVLTAGGTALLALACIFLWRELQVRAELLLVVFAVAAAAMVQLGEGPGPRVVGPLALLAVVVGGGLWWLAAKELLLLAGLVVGLAMAAWSVARERQQPEGWPEQVRRVLLWYGLGTAVLAVTGAFYFHFLTLGLAEEHIGRRLVLTLTWLALGIAGVLLGRRSGERAARDAGFAFVGIALLKVLVYDTTHLSGVLRVGGLMAAGLLMLGGAWLTQRSSHASAQAGRA